MVNPGSFKGMRLTFLNEQKTVYANAVLRGQSAAIIADIQRRYFKRFAVEAEHNVDPSEDWLAAVDDNAPDIEPPAPDEDNMSDEELVIAIAAFEARSKVLVFRKGVSHVHAHQTNIE